METMVKFGTPEPVIYRDPETQVAVSAKVLGTAEVYTTGATEGQERDVINENVSEAAVLGVVKFFDDMSKNSVPFSEVQLRISDAQKAITASIKNAGYGVGSVIIHSINCDEASKKAMESAKNNTSTDVVPAPVAAGPKFCPNCGAPTNGAKFCGHCGTKLI